MFCKRRTIWGSWIAHILYTSGLLSALFSWVHWDLQWSFLFMTSYLSIPACFTWSHSEDKTLFWFFFFLGNSIIFCNFFFKEKLINASLVWNRRLHVTAHVWRPQLTSSHHVPTLVFGSLILVVFLNDAGNHQDLPGAQSCHTGIFLLPHLPAAWRTNMAYICLSSPTFYVQLTLDGDPTLPFPPLHPRPSNVSSFLCDFCHWWGILML